MDVSQYLEIFLDETKEHLQTLNTQILELEQNPENMDTINEIFRAAHSLKGMAGTMGYKRMQLLTHNMESLFSDVRTGEIAITPSMIDVIFKCIDALEEYTNNIQESADEGTNDNISIINMLQDILDQKHNIDKKSATGVANESQDDVEQGWLEIPIDDSLLFAMQRSLNLGNKLYGLTISLSDQCLLKAARAFLVFKAVEEFGEVIASNPMVQDIEDERFDTSFSIIVVSERSLDEVIASAASVSEIANVIGDTIIIENLNNKSEKTTSMLLDEEDSAIDNNESMNQNDTELTPVSSQKTVNQGNKNETNARKVTASKPLVNRTVRVDIEKLDVLMNLVSELIIAKNSLVSAAEQESSDNNGFNEQIEYLESVTTNLHESVMKVRMVPIESVVNKFPRMIRDLSKSLNKKMELYMTGEETELDRTVVDEIGDPLMHLLRNAADHGLEAEEVRVQRGKPATGSIYLNAFQDGNNVVIEVKDDGNGINVEAVKKKAIERDVITADQAALMTDQEIVDLLFLPSFSTAKAVTDVSGRGVGLDVVRSKIEALSGEVEVRTKLGEGSTWIIRLPLTLAIVQALMVVVGNEKYAISLGSIQTIEDIVPSDIKLVQNKEVIHLRGIVTPLIRLADVLDCESTKGEDENLTVVIVKKGDKFAGFVIDELMGQQEIVIKSLGKYIKQCKFISGATILGDGEVALILDANALI